ncbi:MAG: hypothetical protein P8105_04670 [Dehalococcoidia bacterium]
MKSASVWLVILLLSILIPLGTYTACKVPASQSETNIPENGSLPAQSTEPAEPAPKKPATFEIGDLEIPATCMAGDPITVNTSISNIGDEPGVYNAIFTVNGEEVDREAISVGAGDSEEVSFEFVRQDTGDCELAVGESRTSVTVHGWEPCEIKYEDGVLKHDCIYYFIGDDGQLVLFEPEADVFKVQRIRICGTVEVKNTNELKERLFTVNIWDKYHDSVLWSEDFLWQMFKGNLGWIYVDVPDVRVDDDFIVEFISHSEPFRAEGNREIYTCIAVGWERNESDEIHSAAIFDGELHSTADYNWFIRVEGECSQAD